MKQVLIHLRSCSCAVTRKQYQVLKEANGAVKDYGSCFSNVRELDMKTRLAALPTSKLVSCCELNGIIAGLWASSSCKESSDYRQDLIHALVFRLSTSKVNGLDSLISSPCKRKEHTNCRSGCPLKAQLSSSATLVRLCRRSKVLLAHHEQCKERNCCQICKWSHSLLGTRTWPAVGSTPCVPKTGAKTGLQTVSESTLHNHFKVSRKSAASPVKKVTGRVGAMNSDNGRPRLVVHVNARARTARKLLNDADLCFLLLSALDQRSLCAMESVGRMFKRIDGSASGAALAIERLWAECARRAYEHSGGQPMAMGRRGVQTAETEPQLQLAQAQPQAQSQAQPPMVVMQLPLNMRTLNKRFCVQLHHSHRGRCGVCQVLTSNKMSRFLVRLCARCVLEQPVSAVQAAEISASYGARLPLLERQIAQLQLHPGCAFLPESDERRCVLRCVPPPCSISSLVGCSSRAEAVVAATAIMSAAATVAVHGSKVYHWLMGCYERYDATAAAAQKTGGQCAHDGSCNHEGADGSDGSLGSSFGGRPVYRFGSYWLYFLRSKRIWIIGPQLGSATVHLFVPDSALTPVEIGTRPSIVHSFHSRSNTTQSVGTAAAQTISSLPVSVTAESNISGRVRWSSWDGQALVAENISIIDLGGGARTASATTAAPATEDESCQGSPPPLPLHSASTNGQLQFGCPGLRPDAKLGARLDRPHMQLQHWGKTYLRADVEALAIAGSHTGARTTPAPKQSPVLQQPQPSPAAPLTCQVQHPIECHSPLDDIAFSKICAVKAEEQEQMQVMAAERGAASRRLAWLKELDEALQRLCPPRTRAEISTFHLARHYGQQPASVQGKVQAEPTPLQALPAPAQALPVPPQVLSHVAPVAPNMLPDTSDVLLGQAHPQYWAVLAGAERSSMTPPTLLDYLSSEWGGVGEGYDISASSVVCVGRGTTERLWPVWSGKHGLKTSSASPSVPSPQRQSA
jgi:hypothetical protein